MKTPGISIVELPDSACRRRRVVGETGSGWLILDDGSTCPPDAWDRAVKAEQKIRAEIEAIRVSQIPRPRWWEDPERHR